ncbi:MAG: hypothetical protein IJ154_00520 [Bacteroidales bacterium]|nr:hypothetical protein [Bacteroidales bacterium]
MDFDFLIPICICVVLPIVVVWLRTRAQQNETNRKTEIMLKAIESGATIDTDFFKAQSQQNKPKTLKEKLLGRLTGACINTLLGVAGLIGGGLLWKSGAQNEGPIFLMGLGAILLAVGIALFIVYFVGKRMLAGEIAAEERALEK